VLPCATARRPLVEEREGQVGPSQEEARREARLSSADDGDVEGACQVTPQQGVSLRCIVTADAGQAP
jgi:hypothetical protein